MARGDEGGTREELQLARPVPRVLERSVRPVLDNNGQRLGRVEIYRDLTAQRVFQAKLLQTEKLAALGQMITGIAHELSNPLTSILGYSQRLLVRKDLTGRAEDVRQIYQEAERASTILRQLLLSARENRPERKRLALNQVVLRAMELQRFGSAAEKIRIELDLDPSLPFVNGDTGQLQQVLMNLIGNARQAIVQEGKAGTIRLRTARSGEHRVLLQVIDDGPGSSRNDSRAHLRSFLHYQARGRRHRTGTFHCAQRRPRTRRPGERKQSAGRRRHFLCRASCGCRRPSRTAA